MPVQPITPREIPEAKASQFPDFVLESFNTLIARNYNNGRSVVTRDEVIDMMCTVNPDVDRRTIFNKHWLDVEDIYRKAGWKVKYDKPVLYAGEDFDAFFEFSKQ